MNNSKQLCAPILFLVFNRPELTQRVFNVISKVRPKTLYIAADGPRKGNLDEIENTTLVRNIVSNINWPCRVKRLFRNTNLGCKRAVSEGISWFFENEEMGIILEDDCYPNTDFFYFMENLLNKYQHNKNVFSISGSNLFSHKKKQDYSYYFSRYSVIWGWGTWRRAWNLYDVELKFWQDLKISKKWKNFWPSTLERNYWESILDDVFKGNIDTWDYQWNATLWKYNGLSIIPNQNLVSNIGFGELATHTKSPNSFVANLPKRSLNKIIHPNKIKVDKRKDGLFVWRVILLDKLPKIIKLLLSRYLVNKESFNE